MELPDWQYRPFVASTRAIVRLDRMLVRGAIHQGASPYGEPLWSSRWVLPLRRRDAGDLSPGAAYWWTIQGQLLSQPSAFLTTREWADEMSRLRKL
jgi:hypothetical protein